MAYATKGDMLGLFNEPELIQLTDIVDPKKGTINETILGAALERATSEIDSALAAANYLTPLAAPDPLIVGICCDIARFHLYSRKPTEAVTDRYEKAAEILDKIAKGSRTVSGAERPAERALSSAAVGAKVPIFGDDFDDRYSPDLPWR